MEADIISFISQELVRKPELLPLKNDTPLLQAGILDSLALLKLLVFVEEEFNVPVREFDLVMENFRTVDTICAHIRSYHEHIPA